MKNDVPKTMSFMDGFSGPKSDVGFQMIFSQELAETIINERRDDIIRVEAGLDGDWDVNGHEIFKIGDEMIGDYTLHDNSCWAKPISWEVRALVTPSGTVFTHEEMVLIDTQTGVTIDPDPQYWDFNEV